MPGGTAQLDLVLTANSPGEVAGWVRPMVPALRQVLPGARISVFVTPCTYAAGSETAVVRALPGVDQAFGPLQTLALALVGRRPSGWRPAPRGAVLFLGGEPRLALQLARRLGYPAFAYSEGRVQAPRGFTLIGVPDQRAAQQAVARGASPQQVEVVGNLMVDGARPSCSREEARQALLPPGQGPVVAVFPGSRPFELRGSLPVLAAAVGLVAARRPGARAVWSVSPFVTLDVLQPVVAALWGAGAGAAAARLYQDGEVAHVQWEAPLVAGELAARLPPGVPVPPEALQPVSWTLVRGAPYDVMVAADVALTVPGTNTAEMAALGLPMVVALPLHRPHEIPLDGLPGLLAYLPVLGPALKAQLVRRVAARVRFAALPNRLAQQPLVPEVRGERLDPAELAEALLGLLADEPRRQRLAEALQAAVGPPGAAQRLAAAVAARLTGATAPAKPRERW